MECCHWQPARGDVGPQCIRTPDSGGPAQLKMDAKMKALELKLPYLDRGGERSCCYRSLSHSAEALLKWVGQGKGTCRSYISLNRTGEERLGQVVVKEYCICCAQRIRQLDSVDIMNYWISINGLVFLHFGPWQSA